MEGAVATLVAAKWAHLMSDHAGGRLYTLRKPHTAAMRCGVGLASISPTKWEMPCADADSS